LAASTLMAQDRLHLPAVGVVNLTHEPRPTQRLTLAIFRTVNPSSRLILCWRRAGAAVSQRRGMESQRSHHRPATFLPRVTSFISEELAEPSWNLLGVKWR